MPKGRYVDLGEQRDGPISGQLVNDADGRLFLEHRNENSLPKGHRERYYVLTRAVSLRFYRSQYQLLVEGASRHDTNRYEFPAGSMIYRLDSGYYEVVHPERSRSIVIKYIKGVFVLGNIHGFNSFATEPAAKSNPFSSGKRPRAPGHL
ncbi:MAG: hypothetical protein WBB94_04095 [Candidatus Saccharimonadaceae bacterium]